MPYRLATGVRDSLLVAMFEETRLWDSFIDYRAHTAMKKAKAATTTAEHIAFLRPLQHTSGMNPELQVTFDVLCNLCSAEATAESIAEYIFYQPQAAVLAL